jgi:hypothetical protein
MQTQQIAEEQLDQAADSRQKSAEALFPLEAPAEQPEVYSDDYFETEDYVEF